MDKILDIQRLKVCFPAAELCAVDDISIQVKKGEIVGIIGESGSGKSITAKSIIRLLPGTASVQRGSILYQGQNLLELRESEMTKVRGLDISYLLQNPMASFNPVKKIGASLIGAIRRQKKISKKAARIEAVAMLKDVGLENASQVIDAYPFQLSGGMLQRAAIAVALANDPEILIADEPTTALDMSVQNKILELLKKMNQERGTSIILISHDISVVEMMCSTVYVMHDGKIVESGEAEKILREPQQAYTKRLLDSVITFDTPHIEPKSEWNADALPLLELKDVCKSFRSGHGMNPVLQEINLSLYKGHVLGILGESGCGKTTLAKGLAGILAYDSGEIYYNGEIAAPEKKEWKEKVQLVMQDSFSSFDSKHTIAFAFEEVLKAHGEEKKDEKIEEVLRIVQLDRSVLSRYPGELSGGQCQRANIARALLLEPEVIIWDEPVSAMDTTIQLKVLNLLKKIQVEKGMTYVFISHDLPVVKYFCDEVAIIHDGKIVESWRPE